MKKKKQISQEMGIELAFDIAKLGLADLLVNLEKHMGNIKDPIEAGLLFERYDDWNQRSKKLLLENEGKYIDFYSSWSLVKEYYPKNFHFNKIKNKKDEVIALQNAYTNLEDLRHTLKEKEKILNTFGEKYTENVHGFYTFTLNREGILYRVVDGVKEEYEMEKSGLRYAVLVELMRPRRTRYYATEDLADACDTTDSQIRKTIASIRHMAEDSFSGLEGSEFIEIGKRGSGYRLGERIRIKQIS